MLHECEDYLVMDSIMYHYLFIERHCMIDNVAKNTFWSTEDCMHWNMIKDYDNDTADGNDNQGKFTRTYGMEPMDKLNKNVYVFNAHQAVWLNFIAGLTGACQHMYQKLEERTVIVNGKAANVWDKDAYLDLFEAWQKRIPEACWIEDHQRKYRRPYELYGTTMFNSMSEGGMKTHQRAQFETYQDTYMSSKYFGNTCRKSEAIIRGNGAKMAGYKLPFTLYSDCYVRSTMGSAESMVRAKRGEVYYLDTAAANINNATIYFYPAKAFSSLGNISGGRIGGYAPEQIDLSKAVKLREIVVSTADDGLINESIATGFDVANNNILEKLYIANLTAYTDSLNLSGCANLKIVDARNSTFTEVSIANNAPIETLLLHNPTVLVLSNLYNLQTFNINSFNRLETLNINNIDNSNAKDLNGASITSQTLVERSVNILLKYYKLNNVLWKLTKQNELDGSRINILDRLFTKSPILTDSGLEKRANCLTGLLTIASSAFTGNSQDALAIYENYACGEDPKYPNLEMEFETSNATLYDVNIYDGDDNIVWTRKVTPGTVITKTFFENGPDGDFKADEQLLKTATAEYSYEFLKTWNVTMGSSTVSFDSSTFEHANPVYGAAITADIHFRPNFNNQKRSYTVQIFLIDPSKPASNDPPKLYEKVWEYGTSLATILEDFNDVPHADNSSLDLLQVYDFKGYSLVKGSPTLIQDAFTVSDDTELYTSFKLESNARKCVHSDWFEIVNSNYVYNANGNDSKIPTTTGLEIKPKFALYGKVTIPNKINDKPVIKISGFANTGITHVFMEESGNMLYVIGQDTFSQSQTLVHFDFANCAVREVEKEAFYKCQRLVTRTLGPQLLHIGYRGFNQAITSKGETITFQLPGSLQTVAENGLSNLQLAKHSTLEFGSASTLSQIQLSECHKDAFNMKNKEYLNINIYSTNPTYVSGFAYGNTSLEQYFAQAWDSGTNPSGIWVGTRKD